MLKTFDLISIGDATLDVFLEIDEATVLCELEHKNCRLCFNYADKIPVKRITKVPGVGNAANAAVGASRLGLNTGFYTILGNDDTAQEIYARLEKEGVVLDYIQFDQKKGSNYSTVLNYKGERTILVYHEKRIYSLPKLHKSRWVYFSSLASGHEKLHFQIPKYIKEKKANLAFNPGTFQLKEGVKGIEPIMKVSEVFMVNKEEAQRLVGDHNDIKKLLTSVRTYGPKIVVITDGAKGSYAFDGTNFYFSDIFDMPVVERTGCGDAYSIGFVCARAYGHDIREAMRWGSVNAAFVLQKIGAQEGLLTKKQLVKILTQNSHYRTQHV